MRSLVLILALTVVALAAPMAVAVDVVNAEISVKPSTQPYLPDATPEERIAAFVPPEVKATIPIPLPERINNWKDTITAAVYAIVAVMGVITMVGVPAYLKLRNALRGQEVKQDEQDKRQDRLSKRQDKMLAAMPAGTVLMGDIDENAGGGR